MIPVKHDGQVIDNLPGEEVEFTINAAAAHLIMQSMADLYSNRSLAVIREYSTNAADSHIEAGISDPIDVVLPNEQDLQPFFTVTDHGIGMDSKTLREVYTSFGDSTKRQSNAYNGLLGYGCKSALAYTNSFTVIAVKDQKKTHAVITRRADGVMVLKEVISQDTVDPNGVTVQIPVNNVAEFNRIALRFYKFWPTGSVLINGSPIENPFTEKLGNNLYHNQVDRDSYIVMGNVPYPVNNPASLFPSVDSYVPFVAYVDNGAVEFVPSREALKYTTNTVATVQGIVDDYIETRLDLAKKEVSHAKTKWEALVASRKWYKLLRINIPYKGKEIPGQIDFTGLVWHTTWRRYPVERLHPSSSQNSINLDEKFLVVTGINNIGSYQKERLRSWAKAGFGPFGPILPGLVYATPDASWKSEWVNPSHIVSWETVKAQTPPPSRTNANAGRIKGSWDLFTPNGDREYGVPLTDAKFFMDLWEIKRFQNAYGKSTWQKITTEFGITENVVIVPANRPATFRKAFPKAKYIFDHLKSMVDLDGQAMYNEEQREFFGLDSYNRNVLKKYDENKVVDPDLKRLIILAKRTDIVQPPQYDQNLRRASLLGLKFNVLPTATLCEEIGNRYPVLEHGLRSIDYGAFRRYPEDLYIYINAKYNAVYAAKKGK